MKMNNYIIKASGNIQDVIRTLKALQMTFGKGATLSQIDKATRQIRLNQALENQLKEMTKI